MELRQYWEIVRRRLWIVVVATALAAVGSLALVIFAPETTTGYQAIVSLAVKPEYPTGGSDPARNDYYGWVASEYLNDDLIETIEKGSFMAALQARYATPAGPLHGSIRGKKAHRVITATVTSERREDALTIAGGIAEILNAPGPNGGPPPFIAKLTDHRVTISTVEPPAIVAEPVSRRTALDVVLRALLGLFAGLGLAFLLDYLDDTVRDAADVERLTGLPVLAQIPAERHAGRPPDKGPPGSKSDRQAEKVLTGE